MWRLLVPNHAESTVVFQVFLTGEFSRLLDIPQDKPTICSGATLGEQIALETYLRAMVNEFDETGIKLMGMDQGFHNYLYYSGKLQNALKIRSISVFDQGTLTPEPFFQPTEFTQLTEL